MKITPREKGETPRLASLARVIFTRVLVSVALLSLRKMGTTRSLLLHVRFHMSPRVYH